MATAVQRELVFGGSCAAVVMRSSLKVSLVMLLAFSLSGVVVTAQVSPGGGREIIRGHVTTDSDVVIAGASIIATRAPDFAVFQATTDSSGSYVLIVPEGTGDYLVHISAAGWQTFRKRVRRDSTAAALDGALVVDAKLVRAVNRIAAVRVEATKPRPSRLSDPGTEVGGAERIPDNFLGMLPPDLVGDIAALALTQPGIMQDGSGYSVLGLGSNQNRTALNGLSFGGTSLPRDAPVRARVSTTAYDPARGGFSGALVSIDVQPGSVYSGLSGHTTIDSPKLQYVDPISVGRGQRFTGVNASIGGLGPLTYRDNYFYSYGAQAGRRVASVASLLDADAALLQRAGIAPDSVQRFLDFIRNAQIPVSGHRPAESLVTDELKVLARVDRSPHDARTLAPPKTTSALTFVGNWSRARPIAVSPTATPGHAGERWQASGQVQGLYSTYVGQDYLWETKSALSLTKQRSLSYLNFTDANVLVMSQLDDGSGSVSALQFGGNSGIDVDARAWSWETISELQLYAPRRVAHRLKLTSSVRLDGYDDAIATNRLGTFTFNSLAELAANRATSFTRTLLSPERTGGVWSGFIAAGDLWQVSPRLQLLYGMRLEGSTFTKAPAYNPLVAEAFGVRNDIAPASVHVSPRLGFTWVLAGASNNGAVRFNRTGRFNLGPTSYIRGGIGEFRNAIAPTLLSNASVLTGLPNSLRTITCIGPATPAPAWDLYARDADSVPRRCVDEASAAYKDEAPSIELFDPAFRPARSWRGNLSFASVWSWMAYSIEGTYSLNLDQSGVVDLNLHSAPSFVLPDEGRPVFVPADGIVATTGAVSPSSARISSQIGRVLRRGSDLKSISRQLAVTVSPDPFRVSTWFASLTYTLSDFRALESGFDGSTFGAPTIREWARAPLDARHQFLLRAGIGAKSMTLTLFGRVSSGMPFTPRVNGDINGDGLANDRAFVFSPNADVGLRQATEALLASSVRIRSCLTSQLGRPAMRNSCVGPWTSSLNAQLTIAGGSHGIPRRVTSIALTFVNPLGGLDQLLHGVDHLHGWGTQPSPDPVLYYVRGFDAAARRFRYDVNPRFGATNPQSTILRAPFRVTLDVSVDLGRNIFLQQIERSLKRGRRGFPGPRLTVDELKLRYAINVPDPYSAILLDPDVLLLSESQIGALQQAQGRWLSRRDMLLTELATYLAALPDEYDVRAALLLQQETISRGWELARTETQENLPRILSVPQLRVVPGVAAALMRAKPGDGPRGRTLRP